MKMNEIKKMAKDYGVKTSRLTKPALIRQIQIAEGNFDCFATPADGYCDQESCLWRPDCFKAA